MILHSLHLFTDKIFVYIRLIENGLPVVHLAQVTYKKRRSTMEVPNLFNLNSRFCAYNLNFSCGDCQIVRKNEM